MKKLLLIYPKTRSEVSGFGQTESWAWPPLPLGYIAALTPPTWDVQIIDEYVSPLDVDTDADVVGITAYTLNATRAYDISTEFRKRGKTTILGGIHASMVPDEATTYADAVVVGEAESIWAQVIDDIEQNCLKPLYHGKRLPLDDLPLPRRDLFSDSYEMGIIQTTRGCPFSCEYCSVTAFHGGEYRTRPANKVLEELATISQKMFFFSDDNFFGSTREHLDRAMSICRGMIERRMKKLWITQATISIADHPDVLRLAQQSGCRGLYIGIESIHDNTLKEMNKGVNRRYATEGYRSALKCIHDHGLFVIGPLIFGSDHDDVGAFKRSLDFMNDVGIDVPQIGIVTPFPGTRLFDRMSESNRLVHTTFPDDWDKYDTEHIYFQPENLDMVDLVRGVDHLIGKVFSPKAMRKQALRTLLATRSPVAALFAYKMSKDSSAFNDYPRHTRFTEA